MVGDFDVAEGGLEFYVDFVAVLGVVDGDLACLCVVEARLYGIVVCAEGFAFGGNACGGLEYVAVKLDDGVVGDYGEAYVLLGDGWLDDGLDVGGGELHVVGLGADDVDGEGVVLEGAALLVAYGDAAHSCWDVDPYLADFAVVDFLYAEHADVKGEAFFGGLYAQEGAFLPVLVFYAGAREVGGEVFLVEVK